MISSQSMHNLLNCIAKGYLGIVLLVAASCGAAERGNGALGGIAVNRFASQAETSLEKSKGKSVVRLAVGSGPGLSRCLYDTLDYELIVMGTITTVLRTAHTPYESSGALQHTVFGFRVDRILKDEYGLKSRVIHVRQEMGDLPWQEGESSGAGFRFLGEPMLIVGNRYLLILQRPNLGGMPFPRAMYKGVHGKSGEVGEHYIPNGAYGQILIQDSKLMPPYFDDGKQAPWWRFETGPQLLGLTEGQAVQLILSLKTKHQAAKRLEEERARRETERQLQIKKKPRPPEDPPKLSASPPPLQGR